MGPNVYLTPPGSFTHFHQDGYGTVDSGHQCLTGYNEVVMFRRMPEDRKKHCLEILNGKIEAKGEQEYDALNTLPHGDDNVRNFNLFYYNFVSRAYAKKCFFFTLILG